MRLQSLLAVFLLPAFLALASAAPFVLTGVFSAQFEAGDQFGAVTVCNNVPAFVGGFRVNTASRQHANLLQDVEVNQRTLPTPAIVDLGVEVKGGAVLAPGNGYRVFALAERATEVLQFNVSADCSTWTAGEPIGLEWYQENTMFSAASIGSTHATFAGGLRVGKGFETPTIGVAIERESGAPYGFELFNGRFGAVGISLPEAAWFVGGGANDFTLFADIEVVTWNATEDAIQVEVSSQFNLSEARTLAAGAYAQGKVFIAGGINSIQHNWEDNTNVTFSNVVDIFDLSTGQRTVTNLPGPARAFLSAVATDEFVFFAAGVVEATYSPDLEVVSQKTTDAVDIYHIASGSWYSTTLGGGARMYASGVAIPAGNVAIFAPGSYYPNGAQRNYTDQLDVVFAISAGAALSPMSLISLLASFFA